MAVRPLRPATRLRLGEPLPHLLADRTRVPPLPDKSFYLSAYGVLAVVSNCCPPALDSSSRVTHPSATKVSLKQASSILPFDLHVLSTPPAFVLSQDQTLRLILVCFHISKLSGFDIRLSAGLLLSSLLDISTTVHYYCTAFSCHGYDP